MYNLIIEVLMFLLLISVSMELHNIRFIRHKVKFRSLNISVVETCS